MHTHANASQMGFERGKDRKLGERRNKNNKKRRRGKRQVGWSERGKDEEEDRGTERGNQVCRWWNSCCQTLWKQCDVLNKTSLSSPSLSLPPPCMLVFFASSFTSSPFVFLISPSQSLPLHPKFVSLSRCPPSLCLSLSSWSECC